eukprot:TRINITY_DN66_c5_g1_i1.p1 TRINITY_DN66_c5_g1~~TRINITY_DN66_c5_g1_i1.p1  ORF type:complete len:554 (-),score=85.44 TRINITY_DN66_c5_g1_i1:327-1988(-)
MATESSKGDVKDPLDFAAEEDLVSPGTQSDTTLGATGYGDSLVTSQANPMTDSFTSETVSTIQADQQQHVSMYPKIDEMLKSEDSSDRYFNRMDTMYSQALSEDRNSDLEDYPEGPAVSLAKSHVHITVSEPLKMTGPSPIPGVNEPYMTYLITTKCSQPSFLPAQTTVRRRFKDVVALANLLKATHRGYFIPPRPEKNPVQGKKMDDKFIEYRRRALERYLNVLGVHEVIGKSEEFATFLSLDGELRTSHKWTELYPTEASWIDGLTKLIRQMLGKEKPIPHPEEAVQSTKKSYDLVRMVKEGLQLHRNRQQGEEQHTPEELQLRSDKSLVEDTRKQLANTVKKSDAFSRRFKRYVDRFYSLGLVMKAMGTYLDEQGFSPDEGAKLVARQCDGFYQVGSTVQEQSAHQLQLFYHYKHYMPAVLEALNAREGALLTLQTLDNEIEAKEAKIEELQNPSNASIETRQKRIANVRSDLEALKAAQESADAQYKMIKDRNQQEIARLNQQQEMEFMDMLIKFADIQNKFWVQQRAAWKRVAVELGADENDIDMTQN